MGDYDICLKVLSRILPDDVTALAFPEMGLQGCHGGDLTGPVWAPARRDPGEYPGDIFCGEAR